ncbi:MAG: hypothetical protein HRT87_09145 [Legionellales bacterium]|nr:hypothetical protein [Legionellales bacterium]
MIFLKSLLLFVCCFLWSNVIHCKTHNNQKYYVVSFIPNNQEQDILRITLIPEKQINIKGGVNSDIENISKPSHDGYTYDFIQALARFKHYSDPHYMPHRHLNIHQQKADKYVQELIRNEIRNRKAKNKESWSIKNIILAIYNYFN